MHTFTAHQSRIRSIAIDPENNALITGSIDGELKVRST
jgi:WD40 repeat protein